MKAFPNNRSEGMELRDYFAAKAMQAIRISKPNTDYDILAEHAYFVADQMMEARKVAAPENKREFTADEMLKGRG
jgi:hypothetical protein